MMKNTIYTVCLLFISFVAKAMVVPLDSTINKNTLIFLDGTLVPCDTLYSKGMKNEVKLQLMEIESRRSAIIRFGERARNGFVAGITTTPKSLKKKDSAQYYLSGEVSTTYNGEYAMLFTFNPFDVSDIVEVDTSVVNNGKFYFEGYPNTANVALISVGNYPKPTLSCEVVLEKGEISVQLDSALVKGTPLNNSFKSYKDSIRFLAKEISNKVNGGTRKYYQLRFNFIKTNINNAIGKAALYQNCSFNDEDFDIIYGLADDTLKNNPYLIQEKERIKNCHEEAQKRSMLEGKDFFDCEMNDIDGNVVKLSDYVGKSKLLLIDVWASWCGPCRAEMPQLKSIYKDYKDKGLSVLGISIDESSNRWKKALEELDLPWLQAVLPKSEQAAFREKYELSGIPYLMLLNQNGKIFMVRTELRSDGYMRGVLNAVLCK